MVTVKTNHQWRSLYPWTSLFESERAGLPKDEYEDKLFFLYKGYTYCFEDFIQTELPEALKGWHGINPETLSAGVVIKTDPENHPQQIMVGNYVTKL
jgi:hypothetical protein